MPRLLDLFCGAGGAAMGYHRAGFDVVGVDLAPQPNYPFEFHQADAMTFDLEGFDAIHASPPCQAYSALAALHPGAGHPELIEATRARLIAAGVHYVIENVDRAPLARQPQLGGAWGVVLCGTMFALGIDRGHLRRHRLFETSFPVGQPLCAHRGPAVGVYGHGGHSGKHRMLYRAEAALAMDIGWMNRDELAQAIPPAYTQHIGAYLLAELHARAAA